MNGLTLMRRVGEKIMIGNDVVVTVAKIGRTQCRINIVAPENVKILREEVYLREKKRAIEQTDDDRAAADAHHALTGE